MGRFIGALLCLTLAGLFYVYEEVEAVKVGYMIRKQEEEKTLCLDRARALQYNIARLEAPNNLERKLEAQRIVLGSPRLWQTLVLPGAGRPGMNLAAKAGTSGAPFFMKFLVGTAQAEAKER